MIRTQLFAVLFSCTLFSACGGGNSNSAGWDGTTPSTELEQLARDMCACMAGTMEKAGIDLAEAAELGKRLRGTKEDIKSLMGKEEARKWEPKLERVEEMSRSNSCFKDLEDSAKEKGLEPNRDFRDYTQEHCLIINVLR